MGYAVDTDTQIGEATAQAATTRPLLVRLLAPRFFTERDEVILSAAVNNDLPDAQDVTAKLILPAAQFRTVGGSEPATSDADGNLHLTARVTAAAKGEHRFGWRVEAWQAGTATITAWSLTPVGSDGVTHIHGRDPRSSQTLVQSGSFGVGQDGDRALRFEVPAEVDPPRCGWKSTCRPA